MSTTTAVLHLRGAIGRVAFTLVAATLVASCACAPFDPTGSGSTTTTDPGATTSTTADPGSTTTTIDPGSTTTTIDPGSTTTTTDPGSTTTTTSTTTTVVGPEPGGVVDVDSLEPRDCVTPADTDMFVENFVLHRCDDPHDMEVIASFEIPAGTYPDDAYPGNDRILPDSYQACQPRFETYVGTPFWDSEFDLTTVTPSPSTWADGDRTITCLLTTIDGSPLTTAAFDTQA